MIYELRTYTLVPNRRAALYRRFQSGALDLLRKHGFDILDMWEPTDARELLIYLLRWQDANAREESWRRFRLDPAWQKLKTESEAAGPMVTKMDYVLLQQAPFFAGWDPAAGIRTAPQPGHGAEREDTKTR
jgi:heme-degrading monooxygenase HmoA